MWPFRWWWGGGGDSLAHEFREWTTGELAPTTSALSAPIACSTGALRYVWAAAITCVFCCKAVCSARKHGDHLGPIKTSNCYAGLVEYPKTHGQVRSPAIKNAKGLGDCLCPRYAGLWKARHTGMPTRRPACRNVDFAQIMDQSKQTKLASLLMINLKAIRIAFGVLFTEKAQ